MDKENQNKLTLLLLILFLLVAQFYWFQHRPSKIRSYCDWKAKKNNWYINQKYNYYYEACLHEKGLK